MQVALAGSMNNALQSSVEERLQLNLDDKSDENGIIHRNAKIGKAAVVTNSTMFEVEIPRSGSLMAKGGGVAESLTTTMLARLPATRVVREVFEGTSDDFSWMVDDLSDAAQYVLWENTVNAVHRELEQKMLDFEQWRAARKEVDASLASLESEKVDLGKSEVQQNRPVKALWKSSTKRNQDLNRLQERTALLLDKMKPNTCKWSKKTSALRQKLKGFSEKFAEISEPLRMQKAVLLLCNQISTLNWRVR